MQPFQAVLECALEATTVIKLFERPFCRRSYDDGDRYHCRLKTGLAESKRESHEKISRCKHCRGCILWRVCACGMEFSAVQPLDTIGKTAHGSLASKAIGRGRP